MTDEVVVEGLARFNATLRAAFNNLDNLDRATEQTARLIQSRARARAPKRTGRLAASLVPASTGAEASVSSSLVYAGVIHNGWAAHGISANPFLIPTATDSTELWMPYYVANTERLLATVKGV